MLSALRQLAEIVDPPPLPVPVSRDPDDDAVLALAVASRADLIVSGDADLLILGDYAGISIVDAAAAVARFGANEPARCYNHAVERVAFMLVGQPETALPLPNRSFEPHPVRTSIHSHLRRLPAIQQSTVHRVHLHPQRPTHVDRIARIRSP